MVVKPFKGPAPLGPDDSIYGRRDDLDALVDILLSDRIVLLCSASGAGKTSLLEAGLNLAATADDSLDRKGYGSILNRLGCMARMQLRGFQVLPKIRVDTPLPETSAGMKTANRFTFSMLNSLEQAYLNEAIPAVDLAAIDPIFYLEQREFLKDTGKPKLLVFDQFEELIHKDPLNVDAKEVFLSQLGRVLGNPLFWAIFAMRSEYVTDFDEYLDLIPTGLSSRFTLQLLSQKGAYDAITKPLLETGASRQISIDEKAALKLVSDLYGNKGAVINSRENLSAEPAIEPLHLQVVCDSLWSKAIKTDQHISESTIAQSGGVRKALEDYFEEQLRQFSKKIASETPGETLSEAHIERTIRKWIETTLISSQKTRNSIYEDDERVQKLDEAFQEDNILPKLCDTYLIRRDVRNQRNLYEISHDRLVEIIFENNDRWFNNNLDPVQRQAEKWDKDKNPELLLAGADLKKAQKWIKRQPPQETVLEAKYINASTNLYEKKKKEKFFKAALFATSAIVLITITTFMIIFWHQKDTLKTQKDALKTQKIILIEQANALSRQKMAAERERDRATEARDRATEATKDAERKNKQSQLLLMAGNRMKAWMLADLGVVDLITLHSLRALQAYKGQYGWNNSNLEKEIERTVYQNIQFSLTATTWAPYVRQIIFSPSQGTASSKARETPIVAVNSTSNRIAVAEDHDTVKIYAYGPGGIKAGGALSLNTNGNPILHLEFQPDSVNLAVFTPGEIRFFDHTSGVPAGTVSNIEISKHAPCFDANGRFLAAATTDGRIWLWETSRWTRRELRGIGPVSPIKKSRIVFAFSRGSELVAVGDAIGSIHVWRTDNPEHVFWPNPSVVGGAEDAKNHGSRVVGIGFTPDAKGLVTVSPDLAGIRLWSLAPGSVSPVKLVLDQNEIERAARLGSFSRLAKKINTVDSAARVKIMADRAKRDLSKQPQVVASAFAGRGKELHFAVSLDNGSGFIVRKTNLDTIESSKPSSIELDTEWIRFPNAVTNLAFSNPGAVENTYQLDRIAGVTPQGDVFIVDDMPEKNRSDMASNSGLMNSDFDPKLFAKYICGKAWRNLTQKEWDIFVLPDEPYQCACPEFGPGIGTSYTECP